MRSSAARRRDLPPGFTEWLEPESLVGSAALEKAAESSAERSSPPATSSDSNAGDLGAPEKTMSEDKQAPNPGVLRRLILPLVSAIAPSAIFIILWQGGTNSPAPAQQALPSSALPLAAASAPSQAGSTIVVTSPDKLEAKVDEGIDFELAIDSTEALPARSIIAIVGMPEGASFSEGRPYGLTGWSLRPDEIGDLRLRLAKATGGFEMHIELVAADGTRLAYSETRLRVTADTPAALQVNTMPAAEAVQTAQTLPPLPEWKDAPSERLPSPIEVATVKTVRIEPPRPERAPHDGALAVGTAAESPAEWVEIVSAVDVHSQPQQSSPTLKVGEKGLKLRVLGRKKGWVQVSDPATSTKGWIYKRFLKAAGPPP
jgi:hypothetical protein